MGLVINKISNKIEYIIMSWEFTCFNGNKSLNYNLSRCVKMVADDVDHYYWHSAGFLSQFNDSTQISFKFKIITLQIKYKTNEMLYYPSQKAVELKEISSLKWTVPLSLIESFKTYANEIVYDGPRNDNIFIGCGPNGFKPAKIGVFQYGVEFASFPKDISRMRIEVDIKEILDDDEIFERTYEKVIHHDQFYGTVGREFDNGRLREKLSFETMVIIKELYDMKGDKIAKDRWKSHNVILK